MGAEIHPKADKGAKGLPKVAKRSPKRPPKEYAKKEPEKVADMVMEVLEVSHGIHGDGRNARGLLSIPIYWQLGSIN